MAEETGDPLQDVVSTDTGKNTEDSREHTCTGKDTNGCRRIKRPSLISEVKSKLQQVMTAAQQDLEATEKELDTFRQANEVLKMKQKEMEGVNKKLMDDKMKWIEEVADRLEEIDSLTRELEQLKVDQGIQEAKMKFDQVELQNSKKHVHLLEAEVNDLRGICNKLTESSTSQSLDYQSTIDSLKQERDFAESEVDKAMQRNKNQTNLLQRLEKLSSEAKKASESQIKELQEELKQQRYKVTRLSKNNQKQGIDQDQGFGGFFAPQSPQKAAKNISVPANLRPPLSVHSPKRSPSDTMMKHNYISLHDILHEKGVVDATLTDKRTSVDIRIAEAHAERNHWKANTDAIGEFDNCMPPELTSQTSSQSTFIDAALKHQKKNFWESVFSPNDEEISRDSITGMHSIVSEQALSKEIMQTMQENAQILHDREEKLKERERAKKEKEEATRNVKQLKSAVKWGLFSIFAQKEGEPTSDSEDESEDEEDDVKDDETIDIDTLRRLAANRTAGLTEEGLNRQLQQKDEDESTMTGGSASIQSRNEEDDGPTRRISGLPNGMLGIMEEDPVARMSIMSDITIHEDFRTTQRAMSSLGEIPGLPENEEVN